MSSITNAIPRHRLRTTFKSMLPGEKAWARDFDVTVLYDGTVWLQENNILLDFAGAQPWPDHHSRGDFLIERTPTGYRLVLYGKNVFAVSAKERDDIDEDEVQIEEVIDKGPTYIECRTCGGRGIHEQASE